MSAEHKGLLVLQGFLAPPRHIDKLSNYIEEHTVYEAHALDQTNWNVWKGQKGKTLDKVKELTDKYQSRIAVVGHSLGGLQGAEVAFENPDQVDEVVTLFSPVWFLRGRPKGVKATAIYSSWDKYVKHPLGLNWGFNNNIDYQTKDHSAPLYMIPIHEIVVANLKT